MPDLPDPHHILRTHTHPLSHLYFSSNNTLLYSCDQEGYLSVTDLKTRRPLVTFKAHENGCLGLGEWNGRLISYIPQSNLKIGRHGRDDKLHVYEKLDPTPTVGQRAQIAPPKIWETLPTNSLNFCRFDIWRISDEEALMVLPNLTDSNLVDIYQLPSFERIHAAVNRSDETTGG
jgi:ASTRA-associated protein 1